MFLERFFLFVPLLARLFENLSSEAWVLSYLTKVKNSFATNSTSQVRRCTQLSLSLFQEAA
jgi:hypothetical protein